MSELTEVSEPFRAVVSELDPALLSPRAAAELAEDLARTVNVCEAAKVRLAARAAEGGVHRAKGFADAADWLAALTGSTMRSARRDLECVSRLSECPETRDAFVRGDVSLAAVGEIVRTEREVPGSEGSLLAIARRSALGAVRDEARNLRVGALDREALYARQRRAREFRSWRDELGMVRGSFALTPDVGVALLNRIDARTDQLRRGARRRGQSESRSAHAADALVELLDGTPTATRGVPVLNVVIDWPALVRGHVHPGERSHIVGGGPIPPRVAKAMLPNAFLKAVLSDGVEVQRVLHRGRRISAELRTALELGPPPAFAGITCAEAGCDRRYGLEWDHKDPVANGGATSLENLQPQCLPHHWAKTERDRAAGLLGANMAQPP